MKIKIETLIEFDSADYPGYIAALNHSALEECRIDPVEFLKTRKFKFFTKTDGKPPYAKTIKTTVYRIVER